MFKPPFLLTHARKIGITLLVVIFASFGLYFSPARQMFYSWRASSLLEEGRELADAGKWQEVKRPAAASMQLEPSVDAFRLFARADVEIEDPHAIETACHFFFYPGATPEDRAWVLKILYDAQDHTRAAALTADLKPVELRTPAVHHQVVRGLLLTGKIKEALERARHPENPPATPELDFLIAKTLARSESRSHRGELATRLARLVVCDDREAALKAVGILFQIDDYRIHDQVSQVAIERFGDDPGIEAMTRLELKFLEFQTGRLSLDKAVTLAVSEFQRDHLAALMRWLHRLQEFDKMLLVSASPEARERREVFPWRLRALQELEKWALMLEELEAAPASFPEPKRLAWHAMAALRAGEEQLAYRSWSMAMDAARTNLVRNWFYELAAIAGRFESGEKEIAALRAGLDHSLGRPAGVSEVSPLLTWLNQQGDSEEALRVTSRVLKYFPAHPLLLNNFFYFKALAGDLTAADGEACGRLAESHPDATIFRSTLAFVLLRSGEPQRALEEVKKINPDPAELDNGSRAILVKALESLGRTREAKNLAESVDWGKLGKEEADLLSLSSP